MATTSKRRRRIRDDLWPDAHDMTYHHKSENGFFTSPRTLPMIARLTKVLSDGIDPSQVYLELWARSFDLAGFVEIVDEEECANAAGFMGGGGRSIRSWRERVRTLVELPDGHRQASTRGPRRVRGENAGCDGQPQVERSPPRPFAIVGSPRQSESSRIGTRGPAKAGSRGS